MQYIDKNFVMAVDTDIEEIKTTCKLEEMTKNEGIGLARLDYSHAKKVRISREYLKLLMKAISKVDKKTESFLLEVEDSYPLKVSCDDLTVVIAPRVEVD